MTDEIDKLRRRIAELEREAALHAAGGSDPRKIALLKAGVEPHKLADAAAAFRPSGNAKQDTWTLDGLTGPVDSLAREWLSTRPWFGGEPEAKPEGDGRPHIEGDRMIFADGSSLPVDMLDAGALLSAAGPTPTVATPEPKPDGAYTKSATSDSDNLPDIDKDWRDAGPFPVPGKAS